MSDAPLLNIEEIKERLDLVEYFTKNDSVTLKVLWLARSLCSCIYVESFFVQLREILKRCHDVERSLQRLSLSRGRYNI